MEVNAQQRVNADSPKNEQRETKKGESKKEKGIANTNLTFD